MLVKLNSSTSGDMIMFADHARFLFGLIGKECTARGVFTTEQLPDAISKLWQAVEEEKLAQHLAKKHQAKEPFPRHKDEEEDNDTKEEAESICIGQRAAPLIRLMEWTLKEKGFILWEAPSDF